MHSPPPNCPCMSVSLHAPHTAVKSAAGGGTLAEMFLSLAPKTLPGSSSFAPSMGLRCSTCRPRPRSAPSSARSTRARAFPHTFNGWCSRGSSSRTPAPSGNAAYTAVRRFISSSASLAACRRPPLTPKRRPLRQVSPPPPRPAMSRRRVVPVNPPRCSAKGPLTPQTQQTDAQENLKRKHQRSHPDRPQSRKSAPPPPPRSRMAPPPLRRPSSRHPRRPRPKTRGRPQPPPRLQHPQRCPHNPLRLMEPPAPRPRRPPRRSHPRSLR